MGVTCVVSYPVPEGQSGQHTVDILQKRVEDLGAKKTGNFSVDCDTYSNMPQTVQQQRAVHVLHNSEQPASCFAVLDTNVCLVADMPFNLLMIKMKDYYGTRKNNKFESKGQKYEMGDFVIKIGSVVLGANTSFKGILVEVEYSPCMVPQDCWPLMKEFMQGFLGNAVDGPPLHLKNKMADLFGPPDVVLQYLEHFNAFRKASGPVQR